MSKAEGQSTVQCTWKVPKSEKCRSRQALDSSTPSQSSLQEAPTSLPNKLSPMNFEGVQGIEEKSKIWQLVHFHTEPQITPTALYLNFIALSSGLLIFCSRCLNRPVINSHPHVPLYLLACETVADTLFNTVWTLGCRPYMNSQREACLCEGEERDEL